MRKLLFLAILSSLALASSAQVRTLSAASSLAAEAYASMAGCNRSLAQPVLVRECPDSYFIFDVSDGFAIISADESARPVLAVSTSSSFVSHPSVECWLSFLTNELRSVSVADEPDSLSALPPVDPILSSQWGQEYPYNVLCPQFSGTPAPTGCVSTAMAQVLRHHRLPKSKSAAIPAYFSQDPSGRDVVRTGFAATVIDWDAMSDSYSSDAASDDPSVVAVATLMRLCGQSVETLYAPSASSALSVSIASSLRDYFGVDADVHRLCRDAYSLSDWEALVYAELSACRPVIYNAATAAGAGHSFVIDGTDGNGLFHVNWGWSGDADGYYALSALRPYSATSFSSRHDVVVGIMPPDGISSFTDRALTIVSSAVQDYLFYFNVANYVGVGDNYQLALAEIDSDGHILSINQNLGGRSSIAFPDESFFSGAAQMAASGLSAGVHMFAVVCRVDGQSAWQLCLGWQSNVLYADVPKSGKSKFSVVSVPSLSTRTVASERSERSRFFSLSGCPVASPSHGLFVVNGALFIAR